MAATNIQQTSKLSLALWWIVPWALGMNFIVTTNYGIIYVERGSPLTNGPASYLAALI
jgi:hypothetical protein